MRVGILIRRETRLLQGLVTSLLLLLVVTAGNTALASSLIVHDLRVEVTDSDELQIEDVVRVDGRDSYRYRLAPWLSVDEVRVGDKIAQPRRSGSGYRIDLDHDGEHEIRFRISGVMPRADAAGNLPSGPAIATAAGAYLPAGAAWVPHDPREPAGFRLQLSIPEPRVAVATGRLIEDSSADGHYRARFEQDWPGEAPSLFIGPYRIDELRVDGLRVRTYFHDGLEAQSQHYLEASRAYIERFAQVIGKYPYADFHVVSAPLPVGLGFPGLTYIDRRIVPLPFMRSRSLAHEVLHNWWGNAVGVDYANGNWAEGLTTYMADYALELDKGEAAARNMRVKWLRDFAALPAERDYPVRDFIAKQHQASQVVGYNKVAFIFHMLREEIGVSAFDDGIRRFWAEHRFGFAGWNDLKLAFEQASGRDLDWFFRQWLEQPGAPRLSLGTYLVEAVNDGFRSRVEILQPVPGYRLGLNVTLASESGEETRRIELDERMTQLEWETDSRPIAIEFDPGNHLFRRLDRAETPPILRDVTLNPTTVVEIVGADADFDEAARALAGRLLDTRVPEPAPGAARQPEQPLLLIVASARLADELERRGLRIPETLPDIDYDNAAWTTRFENQTPALIISSPSSAALTDLLRRLPHYGGQSYVLFRNGRAQVRGLWPLSRGSLYRDLSSGN